MFVVASHVAGESQLDEATALFDFEVDQGTAEDMAGIEELDGDFALDVELLVVGDADEAAHAGAGIVLSVDRLDGFEALLLAFLIEGGGIGLLDAASVGEHDGAEVAGSGGTDDDSVEALLIYIRNKA